MAKLDFDYSDLVDPSRPGPSTWNTLKGFDDSGQQSPILIPNIPTADLSKYLELKYTETSGKIVNNGKNADFDYESGNSIIFDNLEYNLDGFHFHYKSEHERLINGEIVEYDGEIHLVHINDENGDGKADDISVIGLFVDSVPDSQGKNSIASDLNPFFEALFDENNDFLTTTEEIEAEIDPLAFLPDLEGWYYEGSLTTPPGIPEGVENVNWFVLSDVLTITDAQLQEFIKFQEEAYDFIDGRNDRPIQETLADTSINVFQPIASTPEPGSILAILALGVAVFSSSVKQKLANSSNSKNAS